MKSTEQLCRHPVLDSIEECTFLGRLRLCDDRTDGGLQYTEPKTISHIICFLNYVSKGSELIIMNSICMIKGVSNGLLLSNIRELKRSKLDTGVRV